MKSVRYKCLLPSFFLIISYLNMSMNIDLRNIIAQRSDDDHETNYFFFMELSRSSHNAFHFFFLIYLLFYFFPQKFSVSILSRIMIDIFYYIGTLLYETFRKHLIKKIVDFIFNKVSLSLKLLTFTHDALLLTSAYKKNYYYN